MTRMRALRVHVMVEKSFLTGRQVRSVGGMEGAGGWVLPYHMLDMYPAASAAGGQRLWRIGNCGRDGHSLHTSLVRLHSLPPKTELRWSQL